MVNIINHFKRYFKGVFLPLISLFAFSLFLLYGFIKYVVLVFVSPFSFYYSTYFYNHSLNLSLSIDQMANASISGNVDQTISGRLGYLIHIKGNTNIIYVSLCKVLNKFFSQSNHCYDAIEFDRLNILENDDFDEGYSFKDIFLYVLFIVVFIYFVGFQLIPYAFQSDIDYKIELQDKYNDNFSK